MGSNAGSFGFLLPRIANKTIPPRAITPAIIPTAIPALAPLVSPLLDFETEATEFEFEDKVENGGPEFVVEVVVDGIGVEVATGVVVDRRNAVELVKTTPCNVGLSPEIRFAL